jgi:mRNA-degrading endonuclease YafQ of YafQ-DinJ toxin-antitoxin module
MAGYLGGTRLGAIMYNLAHSTPLPALLVGLGWWRHEDLVLALGLVWLAHIGLDRLLAYGLKYNDDCQHTHLGRSGSHA